MCDRERKNIIDMKTVKHQESESGEDGYLRTSKLFLELGKLCLSLCFALLCFLESCRIAL